MGRTFQLITAIGVVVLAVIVIMAIMALTGAFDPPFANPPT